MKKQEYQEILAAARTARKKSPQDSLDLLHQIDLDDVRDVNLKFEICRECLFNCIHLSSYDIAEKYLKIIKGLLPELNDIKAELYYNKIKGVILIEKSQFTQGIEALQKALKLSYSTQNSQLIYNETLNMGLAFFNMKKYKKAEEYFKDARAIALENDLDYFSLLTNLCSLYSDTGETEKAVSAATELKQKLEERNESRMEFVTCYSCVGSVFSLANEYKNARESFYKALELAENAGLNNRIYYLKYQLAKVLRDTGQAEQALELILEAYKLVKQYDKSSDREKILREMANCYEKLGNYQSAYHYQKKAMILNDSLVEEKTNNKIAQIEAQLQFDQKLLEKDKIMMLCSRQAEMGQMISAIAHQWKQPINALGLIFDLIYDDWEFGELTTESLEDRIGSGHEILNSMNETISDFRSFFKEESQYGEFPVAEVIEKAVRFIDYRFRNNNVTLKYDINTLCQIKGSGNQLLQVLLIILNNAFDAFGEKIPKGAQVTITQCSIGENCEIKISDNAGGISQNVIDKIFNLHFSTKNSEKNSGIGLYLAKMIIEIKFKGSISVSNKKQGAEFCISVPVENL